MTKMLFANYIKPLLTCLTFLMSSMLLFSQNQNRKILAMFVVEDNYNTNVLVNNQLITLKFDTGAPISTIDTPILSKDNKMHYKFLRNEKYSDVLGNQKKYPIYNGLNFKVNDLTLSNPEFLGFYEKKSLEFNCGLKSTSSGLLGMNIFLENQGFTKKPTIVLDNEKLQIVVLENLDSETIVGYKEISSRFENSDIFIIIDIAEKKTELLFDTGYNGFITLNKKFKKLDNYKTTTFKNSLVIGFGGSSKTDEIYLQDVEVEIGDIIMQDELVSINSSLDKSLIGLQTIKSLNWIIDFENQKIYAKRIIGEKKNRVSALNSLNNVAIAVNNNVIIVRTNTNKYKVGDIIKVVNGVKVTNSNLCDLELILFKESISWDTLMLEF